MVGSFELLLGCNVNEFMAQRWVVGYLIFLGVDRIKHDDAKKVSRLITYVYSLEQCQFWSAVNPVLNNLASHIAIHTIRSF